MDFPISVFGFSGLPLFMLSSFRISRNSGVHVFRFTEISGFGVSGLAAVLVLSISENEAPVFLGFWVSGFRKFGSRTSWI